MKTYTKFACIYCALEMLSDPRLAGRQLLCPACRHRIVIPPPHGGRPAIQLLLIRDTWDTHVPLPSLEIPTRYRNRVAAQASAAADATKGNSLRNQTPPPDLGGYRGGNPVLAHAA